jgi:ABC-type sugar transport system ATPase subunit
MKSPSAFPEPAIPVGSRPNLDNFVVERCLVRRPAAGITLGVRPEDIQRADSATASGGVVRARVELVERVEVLGGEALVHLDAGGVELTARLPAPVPRAGSELGLLIPVERAHLFDRETAREWS